MEAKELKQNNLIRDIDSGRIGSVLTLGEKKCTIKMPFSKLSQSYEEFEPIELTEEWLLKFGFIKKFWKSKETYYFELNNLSVVLEDQYFTEGVTYFNNSILFERYPKYVHQLQNLYFALTGEELTLKEEK